MLHFTKKRALVAAVVGSLVLSVGAFAYFTNTGSGTGSASVGSSDATTVTQIGTLAALYPTTSQPVSVTVTNPGSGSQHVGSVHLASITSDKGVACDVSLATSGVATAFTMADITINETLAAGATSTIHSGTLAMNDTLVSQDGCQGAVLTLNFTSN